MYKINDIVKVKPNIKEPDWNKYDISGWQGKIIEVAKPIDPKEEMLYTIQWDSLTLQQMPKGYFIYCKRDRFVQ